MLAAKLSKVIEKEREREREQREKRIFVEATWR